MSQPSSLLSDGLSWDDLKPDRIYANCSTRGIDMAIQRARLRFNMHMHCRELVKFSNRYFHPIWFNLREDQSVDAQMRSTVEKQMLNDILDALTIYDIYSGSISVFFTHNGHLSSRTPALPETISPVSYVTPCTLTYRSRTESQDSEPFAIMLQVFIYTFVIPHVKMYEHTCQSIGYLKSRPTLVQPVVKYRQWPTLTKYDDNVFFSLPGWSMDDIPSNVSILLQETYPAFVASSSTTLGPVPPPTSTARVHFDLTGRLSDLALCDDKDCEDDNGSEPPSSTVFHSPSNLTHLNPVRASEFIPNSFHTSRAAPSTTYDSGLSSSTLQSSRLLSNTLSASSGFSPSSRPVFLERQLAQTSEDRSRLLIKVTELEDQVMGLKERLHTAETLLEEALRVNEDQFPSSNDATESFGTRTTQFISEHRLPFEFNKIFFVLTTQCLDQRQWPALLMEQYPTLSKKEIDTLVAAISFDNTSRCLKKLSASLGGHALTPAKRL